MDAESAWSSAWKCWPHTFALGATGRSSMTACGMQGLVQYQKSFLIWITNTFLTENTAAAAKYQMFPWHISPQALLNYMHLTSKYNRLDGKCLKHESPLQRLCFIQKSVIDVFLPQPTYCCHHAGWIGSVITALHWLFPQHKMKQC